MVGSLSKEQRTLQKPEHGMIDISALETSEIYTIFIRSCHVQLLFYSHRCHHSVSAFYGKQNKGITGILLVCYIGGRGGGTSMPFYEQLTLFQTAYDFMKNNQYHLMYMKDDGKEIWLEKTEKNKSNVIRLQQGGFDWKNHLKRDIAQVFQITKNMKKILRSKEIMIYNIYISDYEPVDEWEQLKKPLKLEEKHHPIKMQIYYLTNKTKESELHRLQQDLTLMPFTKNTITSDDEADEELAFYQQSFNEFVQSAKKTNNVFSYGKPFFT